VTKQPLRLKRDKAGKNIHGPSEMRWHGSPVTLFSLTGRWTESPTGGEFGNEVKEWEGQCISMTQNSLLELSCQEEQRNGC
jgi:hypothetical protein